MTTTRTAIKASITRLDTGAKATSDFRASFLSHRGHPVNAYVSSFWKDGDIDRAQGLLFISIIQRFSQMTHIRLPSGNHVHVSNHLLVEVTS